MKKTQETSTYEEIEIGNTKKEYIFINNLSTLITITFSKWKKDTIKQVKFTIYRSENRRLLYRATKCESDNKYTLDLHALFANDNSQIEPTSTTLKINNLRIPKNNILDFYYVTYAIEENYDGPMNCNIKPDRVPGGTVIRP